jgi:hypothetical protein
VLKFKIFNQLIILAYQSKVLFYKYEFNGEKNINILDKNYIQINFENKNYF